MMMKSLAKHGLMLVVALAMPPLYFVLRKRYKIAFALAVIMVALASWHLYSVYFAMVLAFVSELVQISSELFQQKQPPTTAYGKEPPAEPVFKPRPPQYTE